MRNVVAPGAPLPCLERPALDYRLLERRPPRAVHADHPLGPAPPDVRRDAAHVLLVFRQEPVGTAHLPADDRRPARRALHQSRIVCDPRVRGSARRRDRLHVRKESAPRGRGALDRARHALHRGPVRAQDAAALQGRPRHLRRRHHGARQKTSPASRSSAPSPARTTRRQGSRARADGYITKILARDGPLGHAHAAGHVHLRPQRALHPRHRRLPRPHPATAAWSSAPSPRSSSTWTG